MDGFSQVDTCSSRDNAFNFVGHVHKGWLNANNMIDILFNNAYVAL